MLTRNTIMTVALLTSPAAAQSLFVKALDEGPALAAREAATTEMAQASMLFVTPPEPRTFMKHDLITIIVDETSQQKSSQSLDTEKKSSANLTLNAILDPWELLEMRLRQGDTANTKLLGTDFKRKFEGDGEYARSDRFSAKITAEIIEIKPNGTLVLQATKTITKDSEVQTLVLSGVARQEDITNRNTILSSQIASLSMNLQNTGELRESSKKGFLTRVLDKIFDF
ncbi:MAG: flagellar basal body L-ring protein FlgH [Phycisphaeraceae bacterium]|nr:flagellar basal body L-ring protein FlgH [Phycisphaeraceae bacterium]MCW5762497.1 flagellar basal body L-ring protein FlgH [Phycisphaeraceae bacterium]